MKHKEIIKSTINSFKGGVNQCINCEITNDGYLKQRRGYTTFGEMVDTLWNINKQNKKMNFTCEYTIILPLKGTKPIYKKTLINGKTRSRKQTKLS